MKTLSRILPVLLVLALAAPAPATDSPSYAKDYLALQDALASDQLVEARAAAARLLESAKGQKVFVAQAKKISAAQTLTEARKFFKALSEEAIRGSKGAFGADSEVVSCPMAQARWIQKKGSVRNPYYGKAMLECGEKAE
mgnify:CR=1 FL=1